MFKKATILALVFLMTMCTIGCYTMTHQVGSGAQGNNVQQQGQWYVLWGLVPINTVDSHAMAGGAANYTVKTQFTFVDVIITAFTSMVTVHKQTVFVTK